MQYFAVLLQQHVVNSVMYCINVSLFHLLLLFYLALIINISFYFLFIYLFSLSLRFFTINIKTIHANYLLTSITFYYFQLINLLLYFNTNIENPSPLF